jgi:signal transduction histidine kinase
VLREGPGAVTAYWTGGAVLLAAGASMVAARAPQVLPTVLVLESAALAVGVVATGGSDSPLLVCLLAPTFVAGITSGVQAAILGTGAQAAVLLLGRAVRLGTEDLGPYTGAAATWVSLALLTGLFGALARSLTDVNVREEDQYAQALRLLDELRGVTRGMPGSLDPGTVADGVLADCARLLPFRRGAVLCAFGNDRLVPLALRGMRRIPWRPSLAEDGPIKDAWDARRLVVDVRVRDETQGRRRGSTLRVFPILHGERRVGVVVLESPDDDGASAADVGRVADVVAAAGLPLETAALFDELRMSAATEERQRLAREMHDGIAQDLAYLGFEVDAVTHHLTKGDVGSARERSVQLRHAITQLTGDLRLSITDLRSSIGPARGIGAALAAYARSVATNTGVTMNLSLTEAVTRLPADTEVQLLRIAHEALAAARRRPGLRHLSIVLITDPPTATLEIEDDGDAAGDAREMASSVRVMRDRADRIGARLDVTHGDGTRVRVTLRGVRWQAESSSSTTTT